MTFNSSYAKQYLFHRKVTTPHELIAEERPVVSALTSSSVRRQLERVISPSQQYGQTVTRLYLASLQMGTIKNHAEIAAIFEEMRTVLSSYLGKQVQAGLEILPSSEMLTAEQDYSTRLAEATERRSSSRFPPVRSSSPHFVDHLEGKVVVSDQYIYATQSPSTGRVMTIHSPWNSKTLEAVVFDGLHNLAVREFRRETQEGYQRLFTHVPDVAVTGINEIVGNAFLYSLPRALPNGGLPVLFFRQVIGTNLMKQMGYVAMKAFADDIGLEKSALFDFMVVIPGRLNSLPVVGGFLWSTHPDFERKDAILEEALQPLSYQQERVIIPQELVQRYMR